jgi:hypothetical protein
MSWFANDGKCYLCRKRIDRDTNGKELYCQGIIRSVCENCYEQAKTDSEKKRQELKERFSNNDTRI